MPTPTSEQASPSPSGSSNEPTIEDRHVRRLWVRLAGLFGAQLWTSKNGEQDDGTWASGLQAAGLTPDDIARGVEAVFQDPPTNRAGEPMPPSLAQFIRYCQPDPADLGLPTSAEAFEIAAHNATVPRAPWPWRHGVVYEAYRRTTRDALVRPVREAWPAFEAVWGQVLRDYQAGKVPDLGTAVSDGRDHQGGDGGGRRTPPDEARGRLAAVRAAIGGGA